MFIKFYNSRSCIEIANKADYKMQLTNKKTNGYEYSRTHMDNLCIDLVFCPRTTYSSVIAVILLMNTHLNTPEIKLFRKILTTQSLNSLWITNPKLADRETERCGLAVNGCASSTGGKKNKNVDISLWTDVIMS